MGMDDMLGALMGGSQGGSQSGGPMDLLGAMMGGGQAMDQGAGSEMDGISQQTGIPPELVMAGISFLMQKLMGGSQQSSAPDSAGGGLNLDDLLQSVEGDQGAQYLRSSGMSEEFAQQMGLDSDQAAQALQGSLGALRGRTGSIPS
jgi:hypothetical protein